MVNFGRWLGRFQLLGYEDMGEVFCKVAVGQLFMLHFHKSVGDDVHGKPGRKMVKKFTRSRTKPGLVGHPFEVVVVEFGPVNTLNAELVKGK